MSVSVTHSELDGELFSEREVADFHERGFAIVRNCCDDAVRSEMLEATLALCAISLFVL